MIKNIKMDINNAVNFEIDYQSIHSYEFFFFCILKTKYKIHGLIMCKVNSEGVTYML